MRPAFRLLFHILSDVIITGRENIPKSGAYIIAVNHTSLFEAPLVLAFWPIPAEAAGAVEIWERPGQSALVRLYGGIQVHRGQYERKTIETLVSVLVSGRPLLLAPEGTRSHTPGMQRAHPGIAFLVEATQAPVVPVGVVGSADDFLIRALRAERPRIEMHIGKPIRLPALPARGSERRAARQQNADLVMRKIAELLPDPYHGVYSRLSLENQSHES